MGGGGVAFFGGGGVAFFGGGGVAFFGGGGVAFLDGSGTTYFGDGVFLFGSDLFSTVLAALVTLYSTTAGA